MELGIAPGFDLGLSDDERVALVEEAAALGYTQAWTNAAGPAAVALCGRFGFETLERDGTPTAWSVVGGRTGIAVDAAAAEGEHSLKVTRTEPGVTRLVQRVPATQLRAGADPRQTARLRLTGLVRATAMDGGSAANAGAICGREAGVPLIHTSCE